MQCVSNDQRCDSAPDARWQFSCLNSTGVIFGVLVLSLVVNLLAATLLEGNTRQSTLEADELEYLQLSRAILEGRYEFQSRRVLGFPLFLAGLQWLGLHSLFSLQLACTAVFALSAPIITALLLLRFRVEPLWAGLIGLSIAVWPPLVVFGASLYSEIAATPVVALLLFTLALGTKVFKSPPRTTWLPDIAVGVLLGLCMHLRPMYAIYSPFLALTVLLEEQRLITGIRRVAAIAIASAIVFAPWTIAMSRHYGQFVPLSTGGGETIGGAYNAEILKTRQMLVPDGRSTWVGPGKWLPMEETGLLTEQELGLDDLTKDKTLKSRAWQWIIANPRGTLFLTFRKLTYLWGIYPLWNGAKQTFFGQLPTVLVLLLVLVLGVRHRQTFVITPRFWLLPVFVSTVAIITWGSWRFRMPGDIGLLVLAGLLVRDELRQRLPELPAARITAP